MATKAKSQILDAVHETAMDLHRLGFIDKRKMQKYEALCLGFFHLLWTSFGQVFPALLRKPATAITRPS